MRRRQFLSTLASVGLAGAGIHADAQRSPDVIFVPTDYGTVMAMLKLAGVARNDIVYDLGCGDGRFVVTAARQFGARGVGIDIDPDRIKEANELAQRTGAHDRVRFVQADLFEADISEATVVTLYLLTRLNLKPGTRIVSHAFDMGDWKPEKTDTVGSSNVYLWRVPPRG
jgi:SAM-dependent methyltransferase